MYGKQNVLFLAEMVVNSSSSCASAFCIASKCGLRIAVAIDYLLRQHGQAGQFSFHIRSDVLRRFAQSVAAE